MRVEKTRRKGHVEEGKQVDEFIKERQEIYLMDALEGIGQIDVCEHTPDKLTWLDTDYQGNRIIQHFRCKCGKSVKDIYALLETKVS